MTYKPQTFDEWLQSRVCAAGVEDERDYELEHAYDEGRFYNDPARLVLDIGD